MAKYTRRFALTAIMLQTFWQSTAYSTDIRHRQTFVSDTHVSDGTPIKNYVDSAPFVNYSKLRGDKYIRWIVCGHTQTTYGCYSGGKLGPFENACAMMHTPATTTGNIKTRDLYIVEADTDYGTSKGLKLHIYNYLQKEGSSNVISTYKFFKTINLNIKSSPAFECLIASNSSLILVSTDKTLDLAVIRKKKDYKVFWGNGSSPESPIARVFGDEDGRIGYVLRNGTFYMYNDNGGEIISGGGGAILLDTTIGNHFVVK